MAVLQTRLATRCWGLRTSQQAFGGCDDFLAEVTKCPLNAAQFDSQLERTAHHGREAMVAGV